MRGKPKYSHKRKCSDEGRKKISESRKLYWQTEAGIAQRKCISETLKNGASWNKGKKGIYSPKVVESMVACNRGKARSLQTRDKLSESMTNQYLDGKRKSYTSRSGVRADLVDYGNIMSAFEANYIRYLKYIGKDFNYQIPILLSNDRWYICDFYIKSDNEFIETKGYLDLKHKEKYQLLQNDYPRMNWRMVMQRSDEWKKIEKTYKDIIPNWEYVR